MEEDFDNLAVGFASDDRYVLAKHLMIYPTAEDLDAVESLVSMVECGLKQVSDWMEGLKQTSGTTTRHRDQAIPVTGPLLCGVMRVGAFVKTLLIKGVMDLDLVLLCRDKPTKILLTIICNNLTFQIKKLTEERYQIQPCIPKAAILVYKIKRPDLQLKLTLTSLQMRDRESEKAKVASTSQSYPSHLLDQQSCLAALVSVRHAKWFQVRVSGHKSCLIVQRIFRYMCHTMPVWDPVKGWPMELICEKAVAMSVQSLGPVAVFRRVLECISSGVLLPGGPGIHDPCEKEPTDTLLTMTDGQAEAITSYAQNALRLLVFGQIHQVLQLDPLPHDLMQTVQAPGEMRISRKRRFENRATDEHANKRMKLNLTETLHRENIAPDLTPGYPSTNLNPVVATGGKLHMEGRGSASPASSTAKSSVCSTATEVCAGGRGRGGPMICRTPLPLMALPPPCFRPASGIPHGYGPPNGFSSRAFSFPVMRRFPPPFLHPFYPVRHGMR